MGHDLQKSLNPAPIFNSENHIILDQDTRAVPPAHVRAALWQAAVHGQAATTIWIWEHSFDSKSDQWASILERPDAVEAVGLTNIDLNRAAAELRVLQDASSNVMILSSVSALVWDRQVTAITEALYTALSFSGLKVGFVTERQLENGFHPSASVLFIPGNDHLSQAALLALSGYQGRVVYVGSKHLLSRDDHDRTVTVNVPAEVIGEAGADSWRTLWSELLGKLSQWGAAPPLEITDARGGPVWGIEWRGVRGASNAWLVNLCNYRYDSVTLQVLREGHVPRGVDVLTGSRLQSPLTLGSLETKLIRLD
jgi:hypothetical protein